MVCKGEEPAAQTLRNELQCLDCEVVARNVSLEKNASFVELLMHNWFRCSKCLAPLLNAQLYQ